MYKELSEQSLKLKLNNPTKTNTPDENKEQELEEDSELQEKFYQTINTTPAKNSRILRLPEVIARTGLRKTTVYQRIRDGCFPPNFPLGGVKSRSRGWLESDIENWISDHANLK